MLIASAYATNYDARHWISSHYNNHIQLSYSQWDMQIGINIALGSEISSISGVQLST
jgi:hypothetical protein